MNDVKRHRRWVDMSPYVLAGIIWIIPAFVWVSSFFTNEEPSAWFWPVMFALCTIYSVLVLLAWVWRKK